MFKKLLSFIPSRNDRLIRQWRRTADKIGSLEPEISALDDQGLKAKALECKELAKKMFAECGSDARAFTEKSAGSAALALCFAVGREASKRILGMRHFDVQLIGGMCLHEGKLAEMRTGEGKTLVITLPAIFNACAGIPVHVVTVNEYLARRDAEKMSQLYEFFDLQTGLLANGQSAEEKRQEYAKPIVYGVNHEFGFDYLKENLVVSAQERFMGKMGFAIVDEVDSILIDEARTPLIITAEDNDNLEVYPLMMALADSLREKDVEVDFKMRQTTLTESGYERVESHLTACGLLEKGGHLYDSAGIHLLRALNACVQAKHLFLRDQHYIVKDGKIAIVDEFTGRLMEDRRWSNGIHQAIEAKEGVQIKQESKTLASVTYQNYFRLYPKLSGLTGTAMTQASEFWEIYGLETVEIPTNRPMVRADMADAIYRTQKEKWLAVAEQIALASSNGQPVLAGTGSIEDSETLSAVLESQGVAHTVLNAKNHALEAQIIEQAGRPGSVTVATNMAGRGTDIVLGGNPEPEIRALDREDPDYEQKQKAVLDAWRALRDKAVEAGGLFVIGTCRHESRRVDNQLRGRSGRQGDPGRSKFFVSLEDSLFRHAQRGFIALIDRFQLMPEGTSLEHPMLSNALERAQRGVEGIHFSMRKNVIDYDDVAAAQRKAVYGWRDAILDAEDPGQYSLSFLREAFEEDFDELAAPESMPEQWDAAQIGKKMAAEFEYAREDWQELANSFDDAGAFKEAVWEGLRGQWEQTVAQMPDGAQEEQRALIIGVLDDYWREHLTAMSQLLDSIHLRAYAQKDPKREYKREAFEMFKLMRAGIAHTCAGLLMRMRQRKAQESFDVRALLDAEQLSAFEQLLAEGKAVEIRQGEDGRFTVAEAEAEPAAESQEG